MGRLTRLAERGRFWKPRELVWQPTWKRGIQHASNKYAKDAETLSQLSKFLKNPNNQRMLSRGIVPSELKSPTYRQLFKESLASGTGLKAGLAIGVGMGAGMAYRDVLPESEAAIVGLILGGMGAASAFGIPGIADAAGGKIKHRVSPEGRAEAKARTFKKLTPEQIQKASKFFAKQAIEANARANELRARLSNKLQTQ
jgi:hypothetical protein